MDAFNEILNRPELLIQTVSLLLVFIGLLFTYWQLRAGNRLKRQEYYTNLELASIDLFRLEIEHPELMTVYEEDIEEELSGQQIDRLEEFVSSLLNLFEIHYRLRISGDIDAVVFASWIPWLFELMKGKLFREIWGGLQINYIPKFRFFLNQLIKITENPNATDEEKERDFYRKAAELIGCPVIRNWLSQEEG